MKSFLSAKLTGSAVYSHTVLVFMLLLFSSIANAALSLRFLDGDTSNPHVGLYDDVLDITWLADANLALSNTFGVSGFNAAGEADFDTATAFVAAANADNGGDGYLGVNTWRLPTIEPQNGTDFDLVFTFDGSSDRGYNISAPIDPVFNAFGQSPDFIGSEFTYHYYNNLGGVAAASGPGAGGPGFADVTFFILDLALQDRIGTDGATNTENLALFSNLREGLFWTGASAQPEDPNSSRFVNSTLSGNQLLVSANSTSLTWLVASGDVFNPVPVPAAAWLFGSAVIGLFAVRRRAA